MPRATGYARRLRNTRTTPRIESCSRPTATFSHDKNGNLIQRTATAGTTQYRYDSENRLTEVTLPDGRIVRYKYDPFGRRIEKDIAGQVTRVRL